MHGIDQESPRRWRIEVWLNDSVMRDVWSDAASSLSLF